jgi:hypothetical protein
VHMAWGLRESGTDALRGSIRSSAVRRRKAQVNGRSLGWVCARARGGDLLGFVNVPWDGSPPCPTSSFGTRGLLCPSAQKLRKIFRRSFGNLVTAVGLREELLPRHNRGDPAIGAQRKKLSHSIGHARSHPGKIDRGLHDDFRSAHDQGPGARVPRYMTPVPDRNSDDSVLRHIPQTVCAPASRVLHVVAEPLTESRCLTAKGSALGG